MKRLHARGKIVLSDYREYAYFNLFRNRFSRVLRTMTMLVIVLVAVYLFLVGFSAQSSLFVVGGGAVLLSLGSFVFMFRRNVKNVCTKRKPFLYASHEIRFGGNGMVYSVLYDSEHNPHKWADSHVEYLYKDFFRVYENGGFFYFYTDKKSAIILPKRNMTVEEFVALRGLLQNTLGKNFIRCI